MIAVRNWLYLFWVFLCTNTVRCEQHFSATDKDDDLQFWVRDPNFETTTDKKALLKHVISQHVGRKNSTEVVHELKVLRRKGISLDRIIDQMEKSSNKMTGKYNENNQRNNHIERNVHKDGGFKSKQRKTKHKLSMRRVNNKDDDKHNSSKNNEHDKTNVGIDKKTVEADTEKPGKGTEPSGEHDQVTEKIDKKTEEPKTDKQDKGTQPKDEHDQTTEETEVKIQKPIRKHLRSDVNDQEEEEESVRLSPYTIQNQLRGLLSENAFPDANVTLEVIGRTVEYNDIVMIKATKCERYMRASQDKFDDDVPERKTFLIVHGLSPMGMNEIPCLTYMDKFRQLLSFYFKHLDKFDIFVIPMANPDGIAHARSVSIWNKNVSPQSACSGVFLDRNFDVAWNISRKVSSCHPQYPGPMPFSERETKAIRDVFHRHHDKLFGYFYVHAGAFSSASSFKGDAILYPKGYTAVQTDDDNYVDMKGDIEEVLFNADFKRYSVYMETLYNWYGEISGSSVDFASTIYGIPYALELVMQPMVKEPVLELPNQENSWRNAVFVEVWQRVIDAIFEHIDRSKAENQLSRRFVTVKAADLKRR